MTDNTPVVPTDAEIEALGHRMCWRYKHDTGVNHISTFTFHAQTLHDFARAVLAKWGAQQAPDPRQVIEMCKKALAEELAAWDIDPPLHHVLEAHDACTAWLAAAPHPVACEPLIRQLVASLEGYRRNHDDAQPCDAERAAHAWLEGKK